MVYTSSNILDTVKRNQTITSSAFRFTDADLYSMVDEEIENTIVPMILRLHSDRLIYREVVALVASQSNYDIPYRAIGSQLRDVILQDSATSPSWKRDLSYFEYSDAQLSVQTGEPNGFYFSGDQIYLVPGVGSSTSDYLSFSYPIKHPRMVASSAVATISSVNYTTGVVTLAADAPSSWTTSDYFDFLLANVRSKPRILSYDINSSSIVTTSMTFAVADIPLGLVAGDKITLAQETDVLLLPDECFKYLCKAVSIKIMEAQKDLQAVQAAQPSFDKARMAMESILTPRITGEARVIINRTGLIRRYQRRSIGTTTLP